MLWTTLRSSFLAFSAQCNVFLSLQAYKGGITCNNSTQGVAHQLCNARYVGTLCTLIVHIEEHCLYRGNQDSRGVWRHTSGCILSHPQPRIRTQLPRAAHHPWGTEAPRRTSPTAPGQSWWGTGSVLPQLPPPHTEVLHPVSSSACTADHDEMSRSNL